MPIETLKIVNSKIDAGEFVEAEKLARSLLLYLEENDDGSEYFSVLYFNLCGYLIDIGHNTGKEDLSNRGIFVLEDFKERFEKVVPLHSYYYNLANAKSNVVEKKSPFGLTFQNIESLVSAKNNYWRAIKEANKSGLVPPEYYVNLANCLKQQFRLSESLGYYDTVISMNVDIPQAHVNKSDSLMLLNAVSNSYSCKMLWDVIQGYQAASVSKNLPLSYAEYYAKKAEGLLAKFKEQGINVSEDDINELSEYRKFCCKNYLTLSEHGLYCSCAGSARDNLTIPLRTISMSGGFVPQMEMVLNRLKSEFSLARRNYYEYLNNDEDIELLHEDCFTELHNGECLGMSYEKLRSVFRLCFGILDKIAMAICELFDFTPQSGKVYFQNFWQLDRDNRRERFEKIKSPGLLSLYSIATDLNEYKNGEWKEFKQWRNSLEHGFFVVTESRDVNDVYQSYRFTKDIELVYVKDFEYFVKQMLHLTRSAVFSFAFTIRSKALESSDKQGILQHLERKNFR
jgi:tetratricopeptide (TPR) repeat protein